MKQVSIVRTGKDVVTGVAKSVSRRYICIENPEVVKLPSCLELLNLFNKRKRVVTVL